MFLLHLQDEKGFMNAIEDRKMATFVKSKAEEMKDFPQYLDLLPRKVIEDAIADVLLLVDSSPIWSEVYEYYDRTRVPGGFFSKKNWNDVN